MNGRENGTTMEPTTIMLPCCLHNCVITFVSHEYPDAEKLQIKVLDMRNRLLGEDHPDTNTAMNNLAHTYWRLTKYADAEKLQIEVLNIRNRLLGEEHLDTIWAMGNLANICGSLGKYADAEKLQIKVLDMRNRLLGEEHLDTIWAMGNCNYLWESKKICRCREV